MAKSELPQKVRLFFFKHKAKKNPRRVLVPRLPISGEVEQGSYFPITSMATGMVFGGRHWLWLQAW